MSSNSAPHPGLSAAQAAERIRRGESNDFRARVGRTYWHIIRDNVFNLFNIVLWTLLIIVILFEDYATALFAGFSVFTNSILGMIQEIHAKRKLDRLAALAASDVRVWRDGQLISIPMRQIVKDDVLPLEPGDRLVVDGKLLASDALEVDESQLTGESDAVFKEVGDEIYSGSFIIAGTGLMVATRVGKGSTINQLSSVAKRYRNVRTPTQRRISALVELMVVLMVIIVPMIFLSGYRGGLNLLEIVRNEVVFVSSVVPQGLVLTATLSLTLGAISISRFQTLVQRVNAVESMANVTVLCFDKTGTLTRNQLAVQEIIPLNGTSTDDVTARLQAYLANLGHRNRTAAAVARHVETRAPSANGARGGAKVREIPFNSSRKWGAIVFQGEILALGAPERVLDEQAAPELAERARRLAAEGLRVLAFARLAAAPADGDLGQREPLALIVLSDQVRPDIQETLDAFRRLNVELKVISGDNLDTVKAIARQAGITIQHTYTGDELERMSDAELESAAAEANLFARVEPDTKRRIIAALKRQGAYVAMVGDGVNDVPALKEAHMAVAMNDGAQITKDVADIVLLNNAMSTLPRAFESGTRITQIIFGTTKLFLTKNFYSILMIFFVGFMTLPFPISPVQISWITFGTVNIPATLIAFQIIRPNFMKTFRRDVLDYVLAAGTLGAINLAMLYAAVFFDEGESVAAARSAITLYIGLYGTLIFWHLQGISFYRPRSLLTHWRITLLGVALAAFTMIVPFLLPEFFVFVPPTPLIWSLIVTIFLLTTVLLEVLLRYPNLLQELWLFLKP